MARVTSVSEALLTAALALTAAMLLGRAQTVAAVIPAPATVTRCGQFLDAEEPCMFNRCTAVGQSFVFSVTGTKSGNIYGSQVYTEHSILSKAAVHVGAVAIGETKPLQFTCHGNRSEFPSRWNHGIQSLGLGAYPGFTFSIANPFSPATPQPSYSSCDPYNVTSDGAQLSKRQINDMLYLHNLARRSVYPAAKEMNLLRWSETLAEYARNRSLACDPGNHITWEERNNKFGFWAIGENIGGGWGDEHNFTHGYLGPIWQWINEMSYWGPYPAHDAHATSGHYNMMLYADTTVMGCAYNYCPHIQYYHVWICDYGEAGNYPGAASYELEVPGEFNQAAQCAVACDPFAVPGPRPDGVPYTPARLQCPQAPTPEPQNWCGNGPCAQGKCTAINQTMNFTVAASTYGNIWGTDVYSDDSYLGEMAIHLGLMKDGESGFMTITCHGPSNVFPSTVRYGVQSQQWGEMVPWTITMAFAPTEAPTPEPAPTTQQPTPTPSPLPLPPPTSVPQTSAPRTPQPIALSVSMSQDVGDVTATSTLSDADGVRRGVTHTLASAPPSEEPMDEATPEPTPLPMDGGTVAPNPGSGNGDGTAAKNPSNVTALGGNDASCDQQCVYLVIGGTCGVVFVLVGTVSVAVRSCRRARANAAATFAEKSMTPAPTLDDGALPGQEVYLPRPCVGRRVFPNGKL